MHCYTPEVSGCWLSVSPCRCCISEDRTADRFQPEDSDIRKESMCFRHPGVSRASCSKTEVLRNRPHQVQMSDEEEQVSRWACPSVCPCLSLRLLWPIEYTAGNGLYHQPKVLHQDTLHKICTGQETIRNSPSSRHSSNGPSLSPQSVLPMIRKDLSQAAHGCFQEATP